MSTRRHQQQQIGDAADVQVAFPPDFDDPRKNGSGSEDGNGGSKARGSGDSLGTKSGSTSLLSMMSGSPRSISTAHDSTGASPRTPLSDHSSTDGGGGATAAGSRRGSGSSSGGGGRAGSATNKPWSSSSATTAAADPRRRAQKDLPAVSVAEAAGDDDMDVPSAHPTPLSAFGGDTDLPSDHPTPGSDNGAGSDSMTPGDSKPVNPSSGSFMQRLKYWGGANRQDSVASVEAAAAPAKGKPRRSSKSSGSGGSTGAVAKEATTKSVAAAHAAAQTVVPPRKAPVSFAAFSQRRNGSRSSSRTRKEEERRPSTGDSSKSGGDGGGGCGSSSSRGRASERGSGHGSVGGSLQSAAPVVEPPPAYSESAASEAGGMSPSELRGCPVMPYDSVTSDAMSVHTAGPPPAYRPGPVGGGSAGGATTTRPSPPYMAVGGEKTTASSSSRSSASWHQRSGAEEEARSGPPPSAAAPASTDFGAHHRAELAALRLARGTPAPGDEDVKEEESDEEGLEMDWDALSDNEEEEAKTETIAKSVPPPAFKAASPRPAPRYLMSKIFAAKPPSTQAIDAPPQQLQQLRQTSNQVPPPPRYMAIVEAANVTSALDNSSTSEQDTSPSEDDGGMMAEILTDRLMEVCSKMEQGPATPEDELSDGAGDAAAPAGHKRRPSSRRRQLSNMSNRTLHSNSGHPGGDGDDKNADSDEGSVMDAGAAARKLRRER